MEYLRFSIGNAKLDEETGIFSLPAGHSCPFALKCKSIADRVTGYMTDGSETEFRCFAASGECRSPQARKLRWNNFEMLRYRTAPEMTDLLIRSIYASDIHKVKKMRIHDSGDFFNKDYFGAWLTVAEEFPNIIFYAYTKSLPYWLVLLDSIPVNMFLTASKGGRLDHLIDRYQLKYAQVVYSVEEAEKLGLTIDHDDSNMYTHPNPFALLIHGTQPAGSDASRALSLLRKEGITGYSKNKKK